MKQLCCIPRLSTHILLILFSLTGEVCAKPTVYVTNYPLAYFTQRIAGESVAVVFPVPADVDPAFWKPSVAVITAMQNASLIFINGATYEKWLSYVSLPTSKIVNTSQSFQEHYLAATDSATHSHGPAGAHAHTGIAFTTWLNFQFAAKQAQAIAQALVRFLPEQQATLTGNTVALERDLLAFDQRLMAIGAAQRAQPLLASHPVYHYLAQRYGLHVRSLLWEPETLPDDAQWQELQTVLAQHTAPWMLWERPPLDSTVARLQNLGVHSVVFDPCGNAPTQGDFLTVMEQNVRHLQQALSVQQ